MRLVAAMLAEMNAHTTVLLLNGPRRPVATPSTSKAWNEEALLIFTKGSKGVQ